jgi:hypothetical protein
MLQKIAHANPVLYYSGLISFVCAALAIIMVFVTDRQVMGVNAWIKPLKFFLSIGIFNWTMALYLSYLPAERAAAIRWYSWMVVIVFFIELVIIAGQAARGQLSHYNVSTPLNGALFSLMGFAILTLTTWTAVTGAWFFKAGVPEGLTAGYWWGIRLGIVLFCLFSYEGMVMARNLQHTVGAPDGSEGLPLLNWSKKHGDLRIAHFVGMHALQVLPLLGYFLLKRPGEIIAAAVVYGAGSLWLFLRALAGKGLG